MARGGRKGMSAGTRKKAVGTHTRYRQEMHGSTLSKSPGVPVPQAELGQHGQLLWSQVLSEIDAKSLACIDCHKLTMLCQMMDQWHRIFSAFVKDPLARDARATLFQTGLFIDRLGKQFGMSPFDRRLIPRMEQPEAESAFDQFLKEAGVN